MKIDDKLKRTALQTALHRLLRGSLKAPERAARNLVELAYVFSKKTEVEGDRERYCQEALPLIRERNEEKLMDWVLKRFVNSDPS